MAVASGTDLRALRDRPFDLLRELERRSDESAATIERESEELSQREALLEDAWAEAFHTELPQIPGMIPEAHEEHAL